MASDKSSSKTVPRLEDFHVSEEVGFMLPHPLVELPEYFEVWNKMNKDLVDLVRNHKLREAVAQMPLLDDSLFLWSHRQLRLAYMLLSFIGSGYIWQEGNRHVPKVIPKQLAIPWYSISKRLGMKPVVCQAVMVLSNYIQVDPSKPLNMDNMKPICMFPSGEGANWFILVTSQIELDSAKGIKALVGAMDAVLQTDDEVLCSSLESIADTLRTMKASLAKMHAGLASDAFFNDILPFLSGWGGTGSSVPEGILFEGACDTPITVSGGSAAQSSPFQCFDIGLGMEHADGKAFMTEVRNYMPPAHADFIRAIAAGPSIKDYVSSTNNARLKNAYTASVTSLRDFRSYHIQMVTKYVVLPARKENPNATEGSLKGTAGTDLIPFLKHLRDTTV